MKIYINWQKVGSFLLRVLSVVTTPVIAELGMFMLLLGALMLTAAFYHAYCTPSMSLMFEMHWMAKLLPVYVLIAYMHVVLLYLAGLWKRWLRHALCVVFVLLYVILSLFEICLMWFYTSAFNATIITLLAQTTPEETDGFFKTYIFTREFGMFALKLVGGIVAAFVLYFLTARYVRRYSYVLRGFVLGCLVYLVPICATPQFLNEWLSKAPYTSFGRCSTALRMCLKYAVTDVNSDSGIISVGEGSPTIVLIIGESYNKHHSSLYGYPHKTTPRQEALRDSGNLYVFNDVVSPHNITNVMLREIFSVHSYDMTEETWPEYPLVPHILRDAGYHVSFASNQIAKVGEDGWARSRIGIYFFNIPAIARRSFDYRNDHIYRFDEGLLKELEIIHSGKAFDREFTILHMKGQHSHPARYYPNERVIFSASDYERKDWQNDDHLEYIAHYDNATHYNDMVVGDIFDYYSDREAIVIYVADHGEEVYDCRAYAGRSQAAFKNANVLKYQHEVPFVIYVSDKYKAAFPDVIHRIEGAVNRAMSSDNVAHMVIGLSGVETKWYDKTRDVLHDEYDAARPRVINTGQVYEREE